MDYFTPLIHTKDGLMRLRVAMPRGASDTLHVTAAFDDAGDLVLAIWNPAGQRDFSADVRIEESKDGVYWVESSRPTSRT